MVEEVGGGGDEDGFTYEGGLIRCIENDSQLTSIASLEEYNLILDFAFDFGIEKGFINPNGEGSNRKTWIGLTVIDSVFNGFEDDSSTTFFETFNQFPWRNDQPNFFDGNLVGALFPINKANTIVSEFETDNLGERFGIICRKPTRTCVENDADNGNANEDDAEGLLSFEIYAVGMIAASLLLIVSLVLYFIVEKQKKKAATPQRLSFDLSQFTRDIKIILTLTKSNIQTLFIKQFKLRIR